MFLVIQHLDTLADPSRLSLSYFHPPEYPAWFSLSSLKQHVGKQQQTGFVQNATENRVFFILCPHACLHEQLLISAIAIWESCWIDPSPRGDFSEAGVPPGVLGLLLGRNQRSKLSFFRSGLQSWPISKGSNQGAGGNVRVNKWSQNDPKVGWHRQLEGNDPL